MKRLSQGGSDKQNARAITPAMPGPRQAIDLPKRSMNTLLSLRLRATAVAVLAVLAVLAVTASAVVV